MELSAPSGVVRRAVPLTPLDLAYGLPSGRNRMPRLAHMAADGAGPVAAIESALAEALTRTPCLLSFSGGRDSSVLLALAVRVARQHGLELPVPVTLQFPGSSPADEDDWQTLVLQHLNITHREHIVVRGDDFDGVGPMSQEAMQRHGLLWPFNIHFHLPIVAMAAGGSVVTGFGGDELGRASASARAAQVLAGKRRAHPVDALVVGLAYSPPPIRRAVHRRRLAEQVRQMTWLTEEGRAQVLAARTEDESAIPVSWASRLRDWVWRSRYFSICQDNFQVVGDAYGVDVRHPFADSRVLSALAEAGGFPGMGTRTALISLLADGCLPETLVDRRTKGAFTDPIRTKTSMHFAQVWSGEGVDPVLVDAGALRTHWLSDQMSLLSMTLMQAAWLHDQGL